MEDLRLLKRLVAKSDATAGFCGGGGSSLDAPSHAIFGSIWLPIRYTAVPKDAWAATVMPRVRQTQMLIIFSGCLGVVAVEEGFKV